MVAGNLLQIALIFVIVFIVSKDPVASIIAAVIIFGLGELFDLAGEMTDSGH